MPDVERIEATTRAFRDWDNRWGGGSFRPAVTAHLEWVLATVKTAVCHSEVVRRRLLAATADLANVVAFMNYDVECHDDARHLWLLGLDASRSSGNADIAGSTLRQLAHQSLHLGRPEEALGLIGLAHTMTANVHHDGAALAAAECAVYQGWCYGAAGAAQACYRAVGQAEELFAHASTDEVPGWLGHFDLAELRALQGHVYHVLAGKGVSKAALDAQPLLREAVATRPSSQFRSRTLNLTALSCTFFQLDDVIEEGVAVGRQAIDSARTLTSPRALSRLRALQAAARPYAARDADVAELCRELHSVMTGAV